MVKHILNGIQLYRVYTVGIQWVKISTSWTPKCENKQVFMGELKMKFLIKPKFSQNSHYYLSKEKKVKTLSKRLFKCHWAKFHDSASLLSIFMV